ncbi:hypothetical protein NDI39_11380 [Microcoleus sp. ZQ-A2]|nr:hypothetical protein [Microcoleus sp. FACHB-1]
MEPPLINYVRCQNLQVGIALSIASCQFYATWRHDSLLGDTSPSALYVRHVRLYRFTHSSEGELGWQQPDLVSP